MANVLNINAFETRSSISSSQARPKHKTGKLHWRKVSQKNSEEKEPLSTTTSITTQTALIAEKSLAVSNAPPPTASISLSKQEKQNIVQQIQEQFKKLSPELQEEFSRATELTYELITKFRQLVVEPACFDQINTHQLPRLMLPYLAPLTKIHLCGETGDRDLEALTDRPGAAQLKEIEFSYCHGYTRSKLKAFLKSCPNLQQATLQHCSELNDEVIDSLAALPQESINLSGTQITSRALLTLLKHCPKLQKIDFSDCPNISSSGMRIVVALCLRHRRQFQEIHFAGCSQIAPNLLLKLIKLCPQQKIINFSNCTQITDRTLEILLQHSSQLKGLHLGGCSKITEKGLQAVEHIAQQLDELSFPRVLANTPTGRRLVQAFREPEITPSKSPAIDDFETLQISYDDFD